MTRKFAETSSGAAVMRAMLMKEYGLTELFGLGEEARGPLPIEARPIAGAAARGWGEGALGRAAVSPRRESAEQLRTGYAAKHFTPEEVIERILARLATGQFGDARHSPFVEVDAAGARAAAAASARRYREGAPLGLLDGIPVPIKDEHHMRGLPTRGGTSHRTARAEQDSDLLERLRAAGAIAYAKTHATEWGLSPTGTSMHHEMPHNVYRPDAAAGGSSTGTAVAVALGFATVGSASDGGGSIRIPATLNGLYGIKPTFGRMSTRGDIFAPSTVAVPGPIAQSTGDLAEYLTVIAATADPRDPITSYAPDTPVDPGHWIGALGRGIRGCRIGIPHAEWAAAEPPFAVAAMAALRFLEREGAMLVDVEIPLARYGAAIGVASIGPETYGNVLDDLRENTESYSDSIRTNFAVLHSLAAWEYMCAARTRAALRRQVATTIAGVDLLALPGTAVGAPAYGADEVRTDIVDHRAVSGLCRFAFLANLCGLPAGVVPVGTHDGIPCSLQFVGDAWDEASVLAAMAHCERVGLSELPSPRGFQRLAP